MASSDNFSYMFLNLVGEVGEFASKVAKHIRKGLCEVDGNKLYVDDNLSGESIVELRKELGDIAWQLAGLCKVMGWSLEEVCQENINKLASRKERHVIDGNGDNR